MRPDCCRRTTLWLSRAMSVLTLEPRPAGKRWLVAGLGNPGLPGTRHSVGLAVLGHLARRLGVADTWARDRRCAADLAVASLEDAQLVLLRPRRLMNASGRSVARAGESRAPEMGRPGGRRGQRRGSGAAVDLFTSRCLLSCNCCLWPRVLKGISVSLYVKWGQLRAPPHESRESGQRPLGRWAVTRATISLCQAELFGLTAEEVYLVHDELDKPLGKVALKLGGSARGHNGVRSCISCLNSHAMPRLRIGIGRPAHPDTVQAHVLGSFSAAEQELLPLLLERATDMLLDHIRERSQRPSLGPDLSEFLPP
ncbi:probable peptidyl-tRNA hydrolase isoform X1 [Prionailurus bengalensis]|nr:probable peptidyl-tRNA hydrolase isoform X1 [Prionailurus bengalensis]